MATITKDDFNYGAALKQVADDRRFKSINAASVITQNRPSMIT